MAKIEENEEGIPVAEPIADDEGKSRRGMLKRIGLTAAALAATALTSSKASAQGERMPSEKPPTEKDILASLRKQGITNLDQLAHRAATSSSAMSRVTICIIPGKYIFIVSSPN